MPFCNFSFTWILIFCRRKRIVIVLNKIDSLPSFSFESVSQTPANELLVIEEFVKRYSKEELGLKVPFVISCT